MDEEIEVLGTGRFFLDSPSVCLIGRSLFEIMNETKIELIIVAYSFTVAVEEFRESFEKVLSRGCRVVLILDSITAEKGAEFLKPYIKNLQAQYKNFEVWDFVGTEAGDNSQYVGQLHAKIVISDRSKAVVGSANFSRNGLLENHELALLVKGKSVLKIADSVDKLISRARAQNILKLRT